MGDKCVGGVRTCGGMHVCAHACMHAYMCVNVCLYLCMHKGCVCVKAEYPCMFVSMYIIDTIF